MSALVLHKIKRGSAFASTCDELDCNRKGRYRLEICGMPVPSQRSFGTPDQAQLCEGHGRKARKLWHELNGEQAGAEAAEFIKALGGNKSDRAHAIWDLRGMGYSKGAIAEALAATGRGESVEQILERLAGQVEAPAVAA